MLLCNVMTLIFRPGESSTLCVPLQFEKLYAHPPNTLYCTPRFIVGYSGKAIFFLTQLWIPTAAFPGLFFVYPLRCYPGTWLLELLKGLVVSILWSWLMNILLYCFQVALLLCPMASEQNGQNFILNIPDCGGCPILHVKTNAQPQLCFLLTKWEHLKSWG